MTINLMYGSGLQIQSAPSTVVTVRAQHNVLWVAKALYSFLSVSQCVMQYQGGLITPCTLQLQPTRLRYRAL